KGRTSACVSWLVQVHIVACNCVFLRCEFSRVSLFNSAVSQKIFQGKYWGRPYVFLLILHHDRFIRPLKWDSDVRVLKRTQKKTCHISCEDLNLNKRYNLHELVTEY